MPCSSGKTSWISPSDTALMQISSTVFSLPLRTAKSLSESGKMRREKTCYSTRTMVLSERTMLNNAQKMNSSNGHLLEQNIINQTAKNYTMSKEQETAFRNIVESGDISVMIGRAGTGKSYTLGAVKEAYEAGGYRVRGLHFRVLQQKAFRMKAGSKAQPSSGSWRTGKMREMYSAKTRSW